MKERKYISKDEKDVITKFLVKDLDEGGKAVGGARSIANNGFIGVVSVSIDSDHIGGDVTLSRGSDKYLLGPCQEVLACALPIDKHTSPFNHQIDLQIPVMQPLTN